MYTVQNLYTGKQDFKIHTSKTMMINKAEQLPGPHLWAFFYYSSFIAQSNQKIRAGRVDTQSNNKI